MCSLTNRVLLSAVALLLALACGACGTANSSSALDAPALPAATAIPPDADSSETSIRFLEDRIKRDRDDFIAYNKLAGYYLQRLRECGDLKYLELALRAAKGSLDILPAEQNIGGLAALPQAEFASHEFALARDHAEQLTRLDAKKTYPFQMLSDALIELGDYDRAAGIVRNLEKQSSGANVEIRTGKLAWLYGRVDEAERRFANAIIFAEKQTPP